MGSWMNVVTIFFPFTNLITSFPNVKTSYGGYDDHIHFSQYVVLQSCGGL